MPARMKAAQQAWANLQYNKWRCVSDSPDWLDKVEDTIQNYVNNQGGLHAVLPGASDCTAECDRVLGHMKRSCLASSGNPGFTGPPA